MPNNLDLLKYGAPPPAKCWGATATIQEDAPLDEDASDAPLNDDVLRRIAASGGARQPEADEAGLASRATSAHTVIPTPHGRARMGERAVSVKELQTAKKYGTVTRARNGRDGAVRWKIEHTASSTSRTGLRSWSSRRIIKAQRSPKRRTPGSGS